ncbi:MAG TPA: class I SAM-dependent methyltransferase [Gemmatimonadales bacterium]|nr:class I SAM-dependent methyltransferase [Gemmatimonadales bacterium]
MAAAAYQRGRPPYPAEAIDWLLAGGARRVLDLGAGTGKLTRQLCDRGLHVVAVEPSAGMREQLALVAPEARLLAGAAEQIPLDDRSVDAVLVAQAWHWIDATRAVPEVARVLAPGGRLGLLWNIRDDSHDWVGELTRIMHRHGDDDNDDPHPLVGPPFGPIERRDVAWRYRLAPEALLDMVASRSYVITLPPADRAAVLAEVRHLLATHPDPAGRDELELPYVTECFRAHLQ